MSNIKPSEISSILQMQLQNMSNKVQFEEIERHHGRGAQP